MNISLDVTSTQTRNKFNRLEEQCFRLHNNKYTYDKAVFTNMRTKFTVTCPEHGDFEITPDKHTSRKQGCPICANILIGDRKRKSFNWFMSKAQQIHSGKYLYNKESYVDTKTKTEIVCPIHGSFMQKPDNHLQGKGCSQCGYEKLSTHFIKDRELFEAEAREMHGNKYDYSLSDYRGTHVPIIIICNQCGHHFKQEPNNHLGGSGCPSCTKHGFDPTKPAILYYLSINAGEAYKIGITNLTVHKRYNNVDLAKIEILHTIPFQIGADALTLEQTLLKAYSRYKYVGPDLLQSGNTELITKDILNEIQNHTK